MYKIKQNEFKISVVIIIFALLISLVFCGISIYFSNNLISSDSKTLMLYNLKDEEINSIINDGEIIINDINNIINSKNYNRLVLEKILSDLYPLILSFFIIVIIFSFILWITIKKMIFKQNYELAQRIADIDFKNNEDFKEEFINVAYKNLENKFNINMQDYKRLNSYLSHEQKNELAILKASIENTEIKEKSSLINVVNNLTSSIDDILTLSETAQTVNFEKVDVTMVCATLCDKYKIIQDNIFFDFDEDESIILAKERWIFRAISNLIDNAIKYGNKKDIYVSVRVKNKSVVVIVKDNGIGINEQKQNLIFKNRYRINELKKDGYGIGLSLVTHVCDMCNGFIYLDSKVNKGSVFYLSFPLM